MTAFLAAALALTTASGPSIAGPERDAFTYLTWASGLRFESHTFGPELPLALSVGHVWGARNVAVEGRGQLDLSLFGVSVQADCFQSCPRASGETGLLHGSLEARVRVGGRSGRVPWLHAVVPLGASFRTFWWGDLAENRAVATYIGTGLGLGVARSFGRVGFLTFDLLGRGALLVSPAYNDVVTPRVRGGIDAVVSLGIRL